MKRSDLERHLRSHGCAFWREGGGHEVWWNPANRRMTAVPRHREIRPGTVRSICKHLDIPRPDNCN